MPNVYIEENNKKMYVRFIANSFGGLIMFVQMERDGWDAMALNYAMKPKSAKV
jgi:hypothetical protein